MKRKQSRRWSQLLRTVWVNRNIYTESYMKVNKVSLSDETDFEYICIFILQEGSRYVKL